MIEKLSRSHTATVSIKIKKIAMRWSFYETLSQNSLGIWFLKLSKKNKTNIKLLAIDMESLKYTWKDTKIFISDLKGKNCT